MKRKNIFLLSIIVLAAFGFLLSSNKALADLSPNKGPEGVAPIESAGPSDADKSAIKNEASARAQAEAAAARAQFEKDMGAPPEAFASHGPKDLPKVEEPKGVPESIRQYVTDAEIVPIYCATVKWKTGEFFAAMNALNNNMVPAMAKVKSEIGISLDVPNIGGLISEGQAKVDGICAAKTIDDADKLSREFQTWGLDPNRVPINDFMQEFAKKMQEKGDELKNKIQEAIQPTIDEETPKIQADIDAEAKSYASNFSFTQQPSEAEIAAMRAKIEEHLKPLIEQKKEQVKSKVMGKVDEIRNGEAGKFQEYGKLFEGMEQKIDTERKAGLSAYEKYKDEAFKLRKSVVFSILDKNLADGLKQLDAAEKDIEEARKSDTSIRSVAEIKADIEADKKVLNSKLDSAMEAGDDVAFEQALTDFRTKWEKVKSEGEALAKQSASKACSMALPQFANAKTQMDGNLSKITGLQSKCSGSTSEECLKVNEFSDRFTTLTSKINDIKSAMNSAETMCQNPESADRATLIAVMNKIKSDGEDLKVYGNALDAEKSKVILDSAQKVCTQMLPQLEAAKTEINRNDIVILKNNLDKCAGKNTEECKIVNQLSSKFNEFNTEAKQFTSDIDKARDFCKNPTEASFEKIAQSLQGIKEDGDNLKDLGKELQADQAEKASEKALCRAIVPLFASGKSELSAGLLKIKNIQDGCVSSKDEKCASINALKNKFNDVSSQGNNMLSSMGAVENTCKTPSDKIPSDDFVKKIEDIRNNKDTIMKLVEDLKAEQDKAAVGGKGIRLEAEEETGTNLLPKTESWHSRKETNPSWRPSYYGTGVWYLSRGGESLSYGINAPTAGAYSLWVRDYVDNFQPAGVRRVTYAINGKSIGTYPEVVLSSSKIDSAKGAFGWHKIGSANLSAGANTMKVTKESTTSGAAILDAFYFTTGNDVPPEK